MYQCVVSFWRRTWDSNYYEWFAHGSEASGSLQLLHFCECRLSMKFRISIRFIYFWPKIWPRRWQVHMTAKSCFSITFRRKSDSLAIHLASISGHNCGHFLTIASGKAVHFLIASKKASIFLDCVQKSVHFLRIASRIIFAYTLLKRIPPPSQGHHSQPTPSNSLQL